MADTADVVVVGAGCIGGAIAYFLSREGLKVKLVDIAVLFAIVLPYWRLVAEDLTR